MQYCSLTDRVFPAVLELGTKEDPKVAETINPVTIRKQKDMREKLAAMKEKRLLNKKLG